MRNRTLTELVGALMPVTVKERIRAQCAKRKMSQADWVREAVNEKLERDER